MRNPIVKSVFVIFCFWYFILYLMSPASIKDLPDNIFFVLTRVVPGLLAGVGLYFLWAFLRAGNLAKNVQGVQLRGAKSEVGDILQPGVSEPVPRGVVPDIFWDEFPWWKAYETRYPHHAAFFRAAAAVMFAQPRMPASPVPGGHANATLIVHSVRVAHKVLAMAPNWKYEGHKNKKGEITFPLLNKEAKAHVFAMDTTTGAYANAKFDPILPLIGFIHDIGKMVCFKNQTPTTLLSRLVLFFKRPDHFEWKETPFTVTVNKREHGTEGARLLRNIPELFNLTMADRDALIIAVGHYHEINKLSHAHWINDRMRSLVHLLYRSDIATGKDEGDLSAMAYDQDVEVSNAEPKTENEQKPHVVAAREKPVQSASSELNPTADWAILKVKNIIYKTNRINGKTTATSCGFKVGKWVYLYDKKLRELLAVDEGEPNLKIQPEQGQIHLFTKELLTQLDRNGWTFNTFNEKTYAADECLWDIAFEKKPGELVHHHSILIASIDAFPELEFLPDAQEITVERPHTARATAEQSTAPPPHAAEEQKPEPATVSDTPKAKTEAIAQEIQIQPNAMPELISTPKHEPPQTDIIDTQAVTDPLMSLVRNIKQVLTAKKLKEAEHNMTVPFKTHNGISHFKVLDLVDVFDIDLDNLPPDVKLVIGSVSQEKFLVQTLAKSAAPVKKY